MPHPTPGDSPMLRAARSTVRSFQLSSQGRSYLSTLLAKAACGTGCLVGVRLTGVFLPRLPELAASLPKEPLITQRVPQDIWLYL